MFPCATFPLIQSVFTDTTSPLDFFGSTSDGKEEVDLVLMHRLVKDSTLKQLKLFLGVTYCSIAQIKTHL